MVITKAKQQQLDQQKAEATPKPKELFHKDIKDDIMTVLATFDRSVPYQDVCNALMVAYPDKYGGSPVEDQETGKVTITKPDEIVQNMDVKYAVQSLVVEKLVIDD